MTGIDVWALAAALVWVLALLLASWIGAALFVGGAVASVSINRIGRMGGGSNST